MEEFIYFRESSFKLNNFQCGFRLIFILPNKGTACTYLIMSCVNSLQFLTRHCLTESISGTHRCSVPRRARTRVRYAGRARVTPQSNCLLNTPVTNNLYSCIANMTLTESSFISRYTLVFVLCIIQSLK